MLGVNKSHERGVNLRITVRHITLFFLQLISFYVISTSLVVALAASSCAYMCGALQLQQLMKNKKKGVPEAHRGGIMEEMARLKKELL